MNWEEQMAIRQKAAEQNGCRELIEVRTGSEYRIRKLIEEYPNFLWKFSEGLTIPAYMMKIADQLEEEFDGVNNIPIDLYPCEYFRIMDHSTPTDLALQPKRFDKTQEQLAEKLQRYYEKREQDLCLPDSQLIPRIACAVRIDNKWYRAKLENVPTCGVFLYVFLVDVGMSRQVTKNDIRRLALKFGHYPPMVVKATVRGALIQRMDYFKVDRFRDIIKNLDYLARCQITTCSEPFQVIMCHPNYELLNICSFLLAPRHGQPSEIGDWIPQMIARDLEQENGVERIENDNSGDDSDFVEDEEDEDNRWDFEEEEDTYLRSFPPATKIIRVADDDFQVERIENEVLIYLTNPIMRQRRQEAEDYLKDEKNSMEHLPEIWFAFGTACVVSYQGVLKRAVIYGIDETCVNVLLIDYGITIKSPKSEIFCLLNKEFVNMGPQVTLISLTAFQSIHYSRVKILRQVLPCGTPVRFERDRKSKDVPTKGTLFLADGTSVEQLVNEMISASNLDLECYDLVPFHDPPEYFKQLQTHHINLNFVYKCESTVIYKTSKLVTSKF